MSNSSPYISSTVVAESVPFDNSTNGFIATDVQTAIEEAKNTSGGTSLPNFSYNNVVGEITIPVNQQMIVKKRIKITDRLIIRGQLCLI